MSINKYTEPEKQFLHDNHKTMSVEEMALKLGRKPSAIKRTLTRFRLLKGRRPFTNKEKELIIRLYPTTPTEEIAKRIGRPVDSVYQKANKLGIKKTDEYIKECLRKCGENVVAAGKAHRFPKGHVPANKGLRRPGWSAGRMKETQFKKGQFSPNRREIGDERIGADGYVYVKIADGRKNKNWKQKHWIEWERENGPVPEGMNIIFRDGNKQNCEIENLMSVTDAELMSKNTFHNYPEPIRQQIHILAGFRRKLNCYAKEQDRRSS